MLFKNIIGQERIKRSLCQSVNENRISHAQLFAGPQGSGNLAMAIAYAQYISCEDRKETESCGICPSCEKYLKLEHPDLHFVFPVVKTKDSTKDPVSDDFIHDWRSILLDNPYINQEQWYEFIGVENKQGKISRNESHEIIRKLNFKTFEGEYKIMIIWLAEKMNISAANKLLKMIEEPPPNTLFLMVSENSDQIIPTILSRAQLVFFPRIDEKSMSEAIEQRFDLESDEIKNIVYLANGNYNKALNIINTNENSVINFDMFAQIMRLCYSRSYIEITSWVDKIAEIGREKQKSFLIYALRLIRENFIMNIGEPEIVYLEKNESEFSRKFSPYINEKNIFEITNEFDLAYANIERNAYDKIVFMDLSLKLISLIRM